MSLQKHIFTFLHLELEAPSGASACRPFTFIVKIDENDQNAFVNIFQWTIDMIIIGFVGCYIPLKPLLTQISWLQTGYYDPYGLRLEKGTILMR